MTRARVRQWLEDRFFLRIHMTLILLGTFLGGLVTTRMLMEMGVNVLALRYAIAVCLAYLVFLVLLKLWLMYVGSDGHSPIDAGDGLDLAFHSGGGGGGGSSSSSLNLDPDLDLDTGGDLEGLIFMIVLIAVVILLGGIAVYYIYTAPALLSEAAFEAVLAASIARRAKKSEGTGWIGAVTRATVAPFLAVLALSILLGWLAQRRCPEAVKLRDAVS